MCKRACYLYLLGVLRCMLSTTACYSNNLHTFTLSKIWNTNCFGKGAALLRNLWGPQLPFPIKLVVTVFSS